MFLFRLGTALALSSFLPEAHTRKAQATATSSDPVLVSRIQFAMTIGYHILWPAYTIGVSGYIVLLNVLWLATGRRIYRDLMRFLDPPFRAGLCDGRRDEHSDFV